MLYPVNCSPLPRDKKPRHIASSARAGHANHREREIYE